MAPAQQGLHADDRARGHREDRLVVEVDLAALDRERQLAGQLQLVIAVVGQAAREEPDVVAALGFDLVHRRVGALDQQLRVDAIGRDMATPILADRKCARFWKDEGFLDGRQHAACGGLDLGPIAHVDQQQQEFVATHPARDAPRGRSVSRKRWATSISTWSPTE
jgi:hypothetical protein